jgi:glutamate-1-semialdehyde 2,1-aminomutase
LNPPFTWVVGEYNNTADAARLVEEHAHELAAVIVEPLQGAAGVIPADPAFLRTMRDATTAHDVLLVFDEVMTARLSHGGMQELLGIEPDLTTLAKFVGGGLSFGALGGRADLMRRFDPSQPDALQHGGTFNNDVLTMAAGAAGLTQVLTEAEVSRLNDLGDLNPVGPRM